MLRRKAESERKKKDEKERRKNDVIIYDLEKRERERDFLISCLLACDCPLGLFGKRKTEEKKEWKGEKLVNSNSKTCSKR